MDRRERAALKNQKPCVIWFTGLSGAGKTTIANLVDQKLCGMVALGPTATAWLNALIRRQGAPPAADIVVSVTIATIGTYMKTYAFPSQKYLERLQAAEELAPLESPRALKGEPGTLFELKLQPTPLRNGTVNPMWVHIHTKRPVYAWQLTTLDDAEFAACHVKSNEQRGYNRLWQNARAAMGHEDVVIHRGKLTPAFCKSLLGSAFSGYPGYPFAGTERGARR